MATQAPVDPDAFTAPFMLTKAMQRDVYPAVDPVNNPAISAEGKVVIVRGATGGIGFVRNPPPLSFPSAEWGKQLLIASRRPLPGPTFPPGPKVLYSSVEPWISCSRQPAI